MYHVIDIISIIIYDHSMQSAHALLELYYYATLHTVSTQAGNITLYIIVGVGVVVAILVLGVITVVPVTVWLVLRHKRSMVSLQKGSRLVSKLNHRGITNHCLS